MKNLVLLLVILTIPLFSSIGKIETLEGRVFIKVQSSMNFKKLKPNTPITKGDLIKTYGNSFATIIFDDNSTLKIYPKSMVKIDKNKTDKNNSKSITLFSGKLWAKIQKRVTKRNFFRINTPTATAGVRGTSFGVVVSSNGSSLVKVKKGRVLFDSDIDPRVLKEENAKSKPSETVKKERDLTQPGELRIATSSINRVDDSINVDSITGIKKKSIILRKDSSASFRLDSGVKPEANIPIAQFETEEKMPEDAESRKKIISWHISNLNHRVKTANHLVFKVSKIAGGIESMKSDKKFSVEQISSTTKKGKKEMDHIAETVESMENSMDAQLFFLESFAKDDPEAQKVFEEHKKFLEAKEKNIK